MKILLFIISTISTSITIINFFKKSDNNTVDSGKLYCPDIPALIPNDNTSGYLVSLFFTSLLTSLFLYGVVSHYYTKISIFLFTIFVISILAKLKYLNFKEYKIYTISCLSILLFIFIIFLTYHTENARFILSNYKSFSNIQTLFDPFIVTFKQLLHHNYSFSEITLANLIPFF